MARESELQRLRQDFVRVRRESGWKGVGAWIVEVASWAQLAYRLLRAWRNSALDIPPLRYGMEKVVEAITHIHLPSRAAIGGGLRIYHGYGLIVNGKSTIGSGVTLYARVTIGERFPGDGCPIIKDHVVIGTGATVLGPTVVESNRVVRANSLLV